MDLGLGFFIVLGSVLATIFFLYFLLRKTLAGFRSGYERGRRDR